MRNTNTRSNNRLYLVRLFLKYLQSPQAGFSLLESLMAVVVVSILMTAMLPMVILSTSSRVQARRVDLATQAARSYTDGVRAGVVNIIDAPATLSVYPFIDAGKTNRNQYFTDVPAPNSSNVANLFKIPGVRIDTNGNGFSFDDPQDLVIQPMRSGGTDLASQGFYMGVRVYRADAFQSDTALKSPYTTLQTGSDSTACPSASRVLTSTGGSVICPLLFMKVDINPSTSTLDQIKSRL
jgi:prepilin-type N-terminal cleavage/methylation domain-containing protein